jgi:hypothetical protein
VVWRASGGVVRGVHGYEFDSRQTRHASTELQQRLPILVASCGRHDDQATEFGVPEATSKFVLPAQRKVLTGFTMWCGCATAITSLGKMREARCLIRAIPRTARGVTCGVVFCFFPEPGGLRAGGPLPDAGILTSG